MARHYLRGWFLIDFPASVPVDWVKYLPGVGSSEDATSLRYISILKVCTCACVCVGEGGGGDVSGSGSGVGGDVSGSGSVGAGVVVCARAAGISTVGATAVTWCWC